MRRRTWLALAGLSALAGCDRAKTPGTAPSSAAPSSAAPAPTLSASRPTESQPAPLVTVASRLNVPWSIAFLPGGDALVSERETGHVLRIPAGGGAPALAMRLPDVATNDSAEGGLLGLAVSPNYASDKLVYAYHTTSGDNRIVRFTLGGTVRPVLTGLRRGTIHNGGRIAFGPDGKLYAGVGETGQRGLAQQRGVLNGKILRINPDGSVPSGNPFAGSPVWSYGHRNVQGLAWDAAGQLWASEFGQGRFDEVNLIKPGHNYGWPDVEGIGDTQGGKYTNPLVTWPTDDASPSGAAIIGNTLYIGALQGRCVLRVNLRGSTASKGTPLLAGRYGRIRAVTAAPDGRLWIGTSNRDGRGKPTGTDDRVFSLAV